MYLEQFARFVMEATAGLPRHVMHCIRVLCHCLRNSISVSVRQIVDAVYAALMRHARADLVCSRGDWEALDTDERFAYRITLLWAGQRVMHYDSEDSSQIWNPRSMNGIGDDVRPVTVAHLRRYFSMHTGCSKGDPSYDHLKRRHVVGSFVAQAVTEELNDPLCTALAAYASTS